MKLCCLCGIEKPYENFYRHSTSKDGYQYRCKECDGNHSKTWRKENPDVEKARQRRTSRYLKYGLTENAYRQMLVDCENKCEICSKQLIQPYVDHCHTTGKVRGILCSKCNFGIGHFDDNSTLLENAIKYLKDKN